MTPIKRGQILSDIVAAMTAQADELAECVALEAGKPIGDAKGEVGAAILQGQYWAGEGMRLHGKSLTSGMPGKYSHTVRQPHGVAALIVPANTPLANIAWKAFPALICGNTVVVKSAEDTPYIAMMFARLAKKAGLPDGVLNVVHGSGDIVGAALVADTRVALISFTGSTAVGRRIAEAGGRRLARVSLELGGKNPFVVCDDADLDHAIHWAALSAFSNAGQRCAAGSRIFVFADVYDAFRDRLVEKAATLKVGVTADSDLGPVINLRQKRNILAAIARIRAAGGRVLCGEDGSDETPEAGGYFIHPTIIEGIDAEDPSCQQELFGPVVTLHPVADLNAAIHLANASEYGLTAAIHTRSVDRAIFFSQAARAGVVNINIGTYGSEPHMPFGGFGASGNGTREPGAEALDVYSELKNISFLLREGSI